MRNVLNFKSWANTAQAKQSMSVRPRSVKPPRSDGPYRFVWMLVWTSELAFMEKQYRG